MNQIRQYVAYAITVLVFIIYYFITHGGSPLAKKVVIHNQQCQDFLSKQKNEEYGQCQESLNVIVDALTKTKEIDVKKCKLNPKDQNSAICRVKMGLLYKTIITTSDEVMKEIKGEGQKGTTNDGENKDKKPKRRRRSQG